MNTDFLYSRPNRKGVRFQIGDTVKLLEMSMFVAPHPISNRVGELMVIEEFCNLGSIKVPAPERTDGSPRYWAWSIDSLELVRKGNETTVSNEDFETVWD